jgi:hypothetical protein
MLIFRLIFILTAIALVALVGMYLFTRNQKYLKLSWQIARFILLAFLIFILLFILERYVLTAWQILL